MIPSAIIKFWLWPNVVCSLLFNHTTYSLLLCGLMLYLLRDCIIQFIDSTNTVYFHNSPVLAMFLWLHLMIAMRIQ